MITLVPYVKAEDGYTVTDAALRNIWEKLVQDDIANTVFYDHIIRTSDEFVEFFKSDRNLPVVILVEDQLGGFAWLNGIGPGFAFGHFAFFKETWGKYTEEMGNRVLDYWLSLGTDSPVISTIIGMIPTFNQRAILFVEKIGFKEIGKIPNLIQHKLGVCLLYYQR